MKTPAKFPWMWEEQDLEFLHCIERQQRVFAIPRVEHWMMATIPPHGRQMAGPCSSGAGYVVTAPRRQIGQGAGRRRGTGSRLSPVGPWRLLQCERMVAFGERRRPL